MKVLRIVAVALLVLGVLLLLPTLSEMTVEDVVNYSPPQPILAAVILILLFSIKALVQVIPLAVLYVSAGVMFPHLPAILIVALGLACEMSIGYFIGKRTGTTGVLKLIEKHPKAGTFFTIVNDYGSTACFLTRLVPIPIPLDVVSMFFGASGVPYGKYMGFSLLGISAKMIPWVVAGGAISSPLSPEFLVPFALCLLVSGGTFLVYLLLQRRRRRRATAVGGDGPPPPPPEEEPKG